MKQQDIIMVCQQNWDSAIGTSARSLAKELANKNRVLYVNMPLDINTVARRSRQPDVKHKLRVLFGQVAGLVQETPTIWVYTPDILCLSINWLRSQHLFGNLNQFNSWLLARSIRKAVRATGFQNYILLQDGLLFQGLGLKNLLKPERFVYYLRDFMTTMPYFRRHGSWVEQRIIKQADLVATNSAYLADYAHAYNPHSCDIGQGCVLSLYQADLAYPLPADLARVPAPRIGYTGFLTDLRLDLDLLLALARRRPAWSIVLVGPEDEAFRRSVLHAAQRVFLGGKAPEQLASYLKHFQVCINPQLINEITLGNYPLKIDEYLAMGKPVVASHTRTMEIFQPHVYLANSTNEWLDLLEKALSEQEGAQTQARIELAQSHTWAASAEKLAHCLDISA